MKLVSFGNFNTQSNTKPGSSFESKTTLVIQTKEASNSGFDLKQWGFSLLSFIPWLIIGARDKAITTDTKQITKNDFQKPPLRFRPYVSKVPWHTGPRAFLSQLFPRYGHYCGPNWSSGKDNGSLVWDRRPIDWLDMCCYCHDMGYDTHDQAKLLEADMAFLECLERPNMKTKGDAHVARLYKTMCITGLKSFLIPYRTQLVNLQLKNPLAQFGWLSNVRWKILSPPES